MAEQQSESKFIELEPFSEEMIVNMGPQHPSTHGVLRLELKLDGEVVREAIPHIGYLHRCFEKHCEKLSYPQIIPFTDRMDYIAAMNQNWGFCLAVEKLMEMDEKKKFEVPERAKYLRVLICELNRIASHLLAFGTYGMDMGAFTPFLYAFRDREKILLLFEKICGARLTLIISVLAGFPKSFRCLQGQQLSRSSWMRLRKSSIISSQRLMNIIRFLRKTAFLPNEPLALL